MDPDGVGALTIFLTRSQLPEVDPRLVVEECAEDIVDVVMARLQSS